VPRTFGAGHQLVDHLRLTVRSPEQDDRLIEAMTAIRAEELDSRAKGKTPERSAAVDATRTRRGEDDR
jgi:hypothetical protein